MKSKIAFLTFLIIAVAAIVIIPGCYNSKADLIIPNNNCDTTVDISYRTDITNILQQNCYICHSAEKYVSSGGFHQLDKFSGLQEMVTNGKLLKAINHFPGAVPMPYGGGKLSDCDIMKITAWVNRGAHDN
jgi:mono/diheme cytochrome c family protein